MSAFLKIRIDDMDVEGYTSVATQGNVDVSTFIELSSFGIGMDRQVRDDGTLSGRPVFRRLTFAKRLDKASPLFLKALNYGEVVEAEVMVFGPDPTGTTVELFRIKISNGRITSVDWDGTSDAPAEETVEIAYTVLEGTDVPSGAATQVSRSSDE